MALFRHLKRNLCANLLCLVFVLMFLSAVFTRLGEKKQKKSALYDEEEEPEEGLHHQAYDFTSYEDYAKALSESASDNDGSVVLALVDSGYLEMAYNFYQASILKHGIDNFLFVSLDRTACDMIQRHFARHRVHCFMYKEMPTAVHASVYESREFREKMYLRRFLILEGIRLGFHILLTDLDVVFVRDPRKEVKHICAKKSCDIAVEWDENVEKYNAGFVFARATDASIKFYKKLARYEISHGVGQLALNAAIREFEGIKGSAKVIGLPSARFTNGITVFPQNSCPEPKMYKDVVTIHNNYILELYNKIFRLKECMLWDWEGSDGYYSNPTRRYITIESAGQPGFAEHQGILNVFAIAKLLHRTVILPKFACRKQPAGCTLLQRMYDHSHLHFIKRFHNATRGNYRESTFLANPRVPNAVRNSQSPFYHVLFRQDVAEINEYDRSGEPRYVNPTNPEAGPTMKEIINWFGQDKDLVLRFDNLRGNFVHLSHDAILGEQFVRIVRQL